MTGNKYIAPLVKLYAHNTIEQINGGPNLLEQAFGKPADELAKEWGFAESKSLVENLRQEIEHRRAYLSTPDIRLQISECLKMLLQIAMYDKGPKSTRDLKIDTMSALFREMFLNQWSAQQQEHFSFVFDKIKQWNTYFISYTNEGAKQIYHAYQSVIDLYVDPETIKKRDSEKDNLLAEAIVHRLRKRLLNRSFYDKENVKYGDDLKLKIGPACSNAFGFLQLVQLETFDVLKNVNWCFEEYQLFQEGNEKEIKTHEDYRPVFRKRFAAMIAGEKQKEVCPPIMPFKYGDWAGRIFTEQRYAKLPKEPKAFDEVISDIADSLIDLKYQIIDSVPL
jgi:hypothetical protein